MYVFERNDLTFHDVTVIPFVRSADFAPVVRWCLSGRLLVPFLFACSDASRFRFRRLALADNFPRCLFTVGCGFNLYPSGCLSFGLVFRLA